MGQGPGDQAQRPLSPGGSCGLLIPPVGGARRHPRVRPTGTLAPPVFLLEAGPVGRADPCVAHLGPQPT